MNVHHSFRFGPFELHGEQSLLTRDGSNIPLGGKTFSLLSALLEHAGKMLSNDELMLLVWPDRVVDESNIRVHINRLRKTLDIDAGQRSVIQTLPLRGYGFVGAVERIDPVANVENLASSQPIPFPLLPLLGRRSELAELLRCLGSKRMVTLVGPGGVGKTELIAEAMRHLSKRIVHIDLSALDADGNLLGAIAAACAMVVSELPLVPGLSRWFDDRPTLLVLDHCCCRVEQAAICCAELLRTTPGLGILVACREPLRIHGEWVYRLAPLALPAQDWRPTADEAPAYPALSMFVNLVSEQLGGYDLSDADAALVVDICRRLDGLPLAIELAAGMVAQLGLRILSAGLADSIALLTRGYRGAPRRHCSLQASMDWSYALLSPAERCLLLKSSRFDGEFTQACWGAHGKQAGVQAEIIGNLVLKSWVSADTSGGVVRYRLFNTIRLYLRDRMILEAPASEAGHQTVFNSDCTPQETRRLISHFDAPATLART